MARRQTPLVTGEFYHVFNRGVEKRDIFTNSRDYKRFLQTVYYYQFKGPKPKFSKLTKQNFTSFKPLKENKLVETHCYCLLPNHFHFILKQKIDNGIPIFLSQLENSYTRYFNVKNTRVGHLLQGSFKAVLIESDEQFIHLSRYIHINPLIAKITPNIDNYQWSSWNQYTKEESGLCETDVLRGFFRNMNDYRQFVADQIDYAESLKFFQNQLIDIDY